MAIPRSTFPAYPPNIQPQLQLFLESVRKQLENLTPTTIVTTGNVTVGGNLSVAGTSLFSGLLTASAGARADGGLSSGVAVTGQAGTLFLSHPTNPYINMKKTEATAYGFYLELTASTLRVYSQQLNNMVQSWNATTGAVIFNYGITAASGTFSGLLTASANLRAQGAISAGAANSIQLANNGTGESQIWALGPNATTLGSLKLIVAESDLGNGTEAISISTGGAATFPFLLTASAGLVTLEIDSGAATDLVLKRNNVTKLTLGSGTAAFALDEISVGGVFGGILDTNSDVNLLLNRNGFTKITLTAADIDFVGHVDSNTGFKKSGTQVVGAQGAAVADATDAASVITQLNAWLARARTHGLIVT